MYHKIIPSLQFTVRTTGVLFDLILLLYFLSSISQIPVLDDTNIVHYVLYPIRYTQQSQNNRTKSVIKSVFHQAHAVKLTCFKSLGMVSLCDIMPTPEYTVGSFFFFFHFTLDFQGTFFDFFFLHFILLHNYTKYLHISKVKSTKKIFKEIQVLQLSLLLYFLPISTIILLCFFQNRSKFVDIFVLSPFLT